jgi:hypothetical protein
MKIGDKVKVKDVGSKAFNDKTGTIVKSMKADGYDWAVLLDGTVDKEASYGFNENELELTSRLFAQ